MKNEITICVGGRQGEGIASLGTMLSQSLVDYGYHVFGYRNFSSRIKGGPSSYNLRISTTPIETNRKKIDILLALDQDAYSLHIDLLSQDALLITDDQLNANKLSLRKFGSDLSFPIIKKGKEFGNAIYGNTIALGILASILSLPEEIIKSNIIKQFSKNPKILEANLQAFKLGYHAISIEYKKRMAEPQKKDFSMITGNSALSLGFLAGGCKFMAAYPITPASEIMETMAKLLPSVGGTLIQAEDEIAAVTMAIGASYAGIRSITATSGPGLSLMSEAISLSGMAEVPLVVVDVQRAGPSTGMPTKQEQSDILTTLCSGHGDFPKIIISPGNPQECFYDAIRGLNLAEYYQCPVIILSDLKLGLSEYTARQPDYHSIKIERGSFIEQKVLDKRGESFFPRYAHTESGISPRAIPGQRNGIFYTTGVEHNEIGYSDTSDSARKKMQDKRLKKLMDIELDQSYNYRTAGSSILIIGLGSTKGILDEIFEAYKDKSFASVDILQLRVLAPFPRSIKKILDNYNKLVFIENNAGNQLYKLFRMHVNLSQEIYHFSKYDGTYINVDEVEEYIEGSVI